MEFSIFSNMWIILLAVTLAVAAGGPHPGYEPVFPASKTFLYDYDGLLLTGMPDAGLARSGLKLKCKLEIRGAGGPRLHLLKISDLEIEQFNGIWLKDSFVNSPKLTQALKRQLSRPIKFEYVGGQVGDIFIPEGASDTAVNIYHGILTILQVTIKRTQNVYSLQEVSSKYLGTLSVLPGDSGRGIGGTCHTSYTTKEDAKGNTISVTKSKDLNDCRDKAEMTSGNAYFHPCAACQQRNKNSRATATYNYKLRVMRVGYILQEAAVHEVHQFTPFNEIDGAAVLEARQRLVLAAVEERAYSQPVDSNDYLEKVSLRYHFPSELIAAPTQFLHAQNTETQIIELLDHLVKHFEGFAAKESPEKFVELVYRLRAATYGDIEALWKRFSAKQDYRRWILDAIPPIANPLTLKFLKHKIDEKDLSEFEAVQATLLALHLIKADHEALTEAKSLLAVIKSQRMPLLRRSAFLAYGSLVQKTCRSRNPCPEGALQPIYELLEEATSAAREEDMILALKALGNSGEPQSIKRIQKFLPGFSSSSSQLPVMIQSVAVTAMRNIALKDPQKVHDICLQLFASPDVQPLIRMVAGAVLLDSKPPPDVVMTLTNVLLREANPQVAGFLFPLVESLSRDSSPDMQEVSAGFKMAATILRAKFGNLRNRYSKNIHYDIFQDSLMAGISSTMSFLYNDVEFIPACAMSRVRAHFMGTVTDLLETCFHAEGLQELLMNKRVFTPDSGAQNTQKILDMLKKLSEWKPLPSKQPLASAYIKMFGQEIFFHQFDKESLHNIFKILYRERGHSALKTIVNHLQNGVHMRWSKPLLSSENRHVVPTCVGLPLETNLRYSSVTHAEIQAQTHITPTPKQDVSIIQLLDSNIQLQSSSSIRMSKNIIFMMGVNTDLIQSGLEIHGKVNVFLPVNIAAEFDINQKNFKLDFIPSAQENEVISLRSKAFSVTRNLEDTHAVTTIPVLPPGTEPNVARRVFSLREESAGGSAGTEAKFSREVLSEANAPLTEQLTQNPHPRAVSTCHKATELGFQICFEKKSVSATFLRNCPLYNVIGDYSVNVLFKPVRADASVEKIQMEFQVGSKAATKMARPVNLQESCEDEQETDVTAAALSKLKKILGRDENKLLTRGSISNTNSSSSSESSRSSQASNTSETSQESAPTKNQHEHHHREEEKTHEKSRHSEEEKRSENRKKHQQKKKKAKKQHPCRHKKENIRHEKKVMQKCHECWEETKNIEHKLKDIQHKNQEIRHEKENIQREKQKVQDEREKIRHEKDQMQHQKKRMKHEKEEMEHEEEEMEHEKKKMEHARTKMEHEKEKMEHAKMKMEHEKERMEHEKDNMQREKENRKENAHKDHHKETKNKDKQRDRPHKSQEHKSQEHGQHCHHHHEHHPCEFRSSGENSNESRKGSLEKGEKHRNRHTSSSSSRSGHVDSSSSSRSGHVDSSSISWSRHLDSSNSSRSGHVDRSKKTKHLQKNVKSHHVSSKTCTGTHPHGTCNKSKRGKKSRTPDMGNKSSERWEMLDLNIQEAPFTSASALLGREKNNEPKSVNPWLGSDRGGSSSSSSSGESDPYMPVSLGVLPEFVLLVRAFMSDDTHRGYQTTGYVDPAGHRAQFTTVTLEDKSLWKACVSTAVTENNKALALVRWGNECQDYRVSAQFSKGQLAGHPAVQLNWRWARVPSWLRRTTQGVMRFVPGMAYMLGFSQTHSRNPSRQLVLRVAATSPETVDTVIKTPELTFYRQAIPVPLDLTQVASPDSRGNRGTWGNIPQWAAMVKRKEEAECVVNEERFVTFDKLNLTCPLCPTNCPTVLAQDCTDQLKFLISVQKMARGFATFGMNIMLGSSDIKVYSDVSENFHILLNGVMLLLHNDTYVNEKECVRIHRNSTTVTVKAPENGVEQVSFDGETVKIILAHWMRGSTCGLCGNADGLQSNDLQKPNGQTARSCNSLVHSWTLADNSCHGTCKLSRQFVMLKNQLVAGDQFTCQSVEPVLRCVSGCSATNTVPVKTAFHCLPRESAIQLEGRPLNPESRLEDLIEEVDAHTDCVCAPECAKP